MLPLGPHQHEPEAQVGCVQVATATLLGGRPAASTRSGMILAMQDYSEALAVQLGGVLQHSAEVETCCFILAQWHQIACYG